MKDFLVYTALRLLLFVSTLAIVLGIWWALSGAEEVTDTQVFVSVIVAFAGSGIASYYLLANQREAFARRVEARASKAASKFEELKSKED